MGLMMNWSMPWWVVALMTCECLFSMLGSSAFRRCTSVFGPGEGPATGFAIRMSGLVAGVVWEGAGQRRPHAFGAGQGETSWVASRTRKRFPRVSVVFQGAPPWAPWLSAPPTTRNPVRRQPAQTSQRGRLVGQLSSASDHGAIGSFGGCHERGKGAFAT